MPDSYSPSTRLTYRPDIDGLRAVAVLLVVFNHLRIHFTGGYIGVDVFFVISGYLIGAVIISEMTAGTFSILTFYERRIRRIFPALLAMLLVTAVLAYLDFVPSETASFAVSMLAAVASVSNLVFWHEAGYFDQSSAVKPLLHTWSLAVEEQFYIFFPIFLVAVRHLAPRRIKAALYLTCGVTFVMACIWVKWDAPVAFFFAPLRAWELLIGVIVSQRFTPSIEGPVQRNLAALIGILLILVPSAVYNAGTQFPGAAALPPCLGAALVIAAGETGPSLVGRLLQWRPLVFVGLISYSLYLWHWPLLVFQKTNFMLVPASPDSSKRAKIAVLALSFLVATLSWRFVETPFRKGRFRPGRPALLAASGTAVALVAVVGVYMIVSQGVSSRFNHEALEVSRYTTFDPESAFRENVCFLKPRADFSAFRRDICLSDDPTRKHYLLLGDSHGAHLYHGLATVFPELNLSQANVAQCRPFVTQLPNVNGACREMSQFIYGDYLLHHRVDLVLLAGRWEESEFPELGNTVAWIKRHGMQVVVFGPVIEYDLSLPRILAISLRDHDSSSVGRHRSTEPQQLDRKLAAIARNRWNVRYISIYEDLNSCQPQDEAGGQAQSRAEYPVLVGAGIPLLFDTDHLTPQGSILFAKAMRACHQLP